MANSFSDNIQIIIIWRESRIFLTLLASEHRVYRQMESESIVSRRGGDFPQKQFDESKVQSGNGSGLSPTFHKITFWHRLKAALFPCLKNSKRLAELCAEARVEKERSEACKIAEQANEIVVRSDLIKQNETIVFNSIVNDIFANDGLPPAGKILKLAKLMENNPGIEDRLEDANKIFEKLCLEKRADKFEHIETTRTEKLSR